jgi:hypothetical protein
VLRQFLYLDEGLTLQFLSQLEGGIFDEESQTLRSSSGSSLEGGVSAGVLRGGGGRNAEDEEAVSRTVRQTPESAFHRFLTLLAATDSLRFVEDLDDAGWNQISRGEIVEVETQVHLPTIAHVLGAAAGLGPLLTALPSLGTELTDDDAEGLAAMMTFAQTTSSVPIIASPIGASSYRLVANLAREQLQVDSHELEGEATVVGKVRRKLSPDERYIVFEFFAGQNSLPRQLREELENALVSGEEDELADMVVTAPAAILTPIAVFR